jgi:hypothetical protein
MVILAASLAFAAGVGSAQSGEHVLSCTNPASGARWTIKIDYDRATVDSNAATISDSEISWHDAQERGSYTLDRKSGNLTFVGASSTGGYFVYDRCDREN